MSVDAHLAQLERKHQSLEREIQAELSHPKSDDVKIANLKRRKLKIKDEIVSIRTTAKPTMN